MAPSGMWKPEEDGRKALLKDEAGAGVDQGMLQDYSADFQRLRAVAVTKVQALRSSVGGPTWADDVRAAERALEAMESNRRQVQVQLRLELSGTSGGAKQEWEQRLQEWAREVASFRGELESFREESGRRSLRLDGREVVGGGVGSESRTNRQTASQSTEMLEQGSRKLEEAVRQALETESVSDEVLSDLSSQRETINSVRSKMRVIGTELSQARQSLTRMLQRAQQNRLATLVIMFVLGFGLMIWTCCFFGLSMKYTVFLALGMLVVCAAGIAIRKKLKGRG